jgi:hypothetical protein
MMQACPHASVRARWARITTSFEGFHRYAAAPEDVAFLRALHRHVFVVTVWIEQFNDERDVEFIRFKRWLNLQLAKADFAEDASCEHMARWIGVTVLRAYPGRRLRIEVAEDGENGALVEFDAC